MKPNLSANTLREHIRGQWRNYFNAINIELPATPTKHGPCPSCGGKDRFRFDDKNGNGSHICSQCGAGDGFSLLMKCFQWTFSQALEAVSNYLGVDVISPITTRRKPAKKPLLDTKKQQRIDATLTQSINMGLPLERYLINRGLSQLINKIPDCLRFHPSLPYWQETTNGLWEQSAICPAMLGVVTNLNGKVLTLHRTFLSNDGNKAPFPHPKKLMPPALPGSLRGCSIKLSTPTDTLCLTEGIETALAVWLDTDMPTWACISATLLESVDIPSYVKHVYIMADKDHSKTGERSAQQLAQRLLTKHKNITVKICLPPLAIGDNKKSIDWLDVYNRKKQGDIT